MMKLKKDYSRNAEVKENEQTTDIDKQRKLQNLEVRWRLGFFI